MTSKGEANYDVTSKKNDLTENVYYQKLQNGLSVNKNAKVAAQKKQQANKVEIPDTRDQVKLSSDVPKSLFNWKNVSVKGKSSVELDVSAGDKFSTSVLTSEKSLGIINVLGLRIDMNEKVQSFIDKYIKNYVQARSHNLMLAKFAQFNVAFMGQLLSMLGMTTEEIRKLQKEAINAAVEENKQFFIENEYNGEMIEIVGGGTKKEIKQQQRIVQEMRTQFMTQMQRLGYPGYYTQRAIKEIQIEQVKKIIQQFNEEKANLEFQLNYVS